MSELQAYLAEKNGKKSNKKLFSGSSGESDSDTAGLLSWVPSSVSVSMPSVFKGSSEHAEKSDSTWFNEAKSDPCCPALVSRKIIFYCC